MKIHFKGEQGLMLLEDMISCKRVDRYLTDVVRTLKREILWKAESDKTKKSMLELLVKTAPAPKFMPLSCTLSSGGTSYTIVENGMPAPDAEENIEKVRTSWEKTDPSALGFGSDRMGVIGNGTRKELLFDIR